jgi:hypothetical protein
MSQYSIKTVESSSVGFKTHNIEIELWKLYRSNYYNNPVVKEQALSGLYGWIEFTKDIWVNCKYHSEVEMLLTHNPKVVQSENYYDLICAITKLQQNPNSYIITGYVKRPNKPNMLMLSSQISKAGYFGVIGNSDKINYFKSRYPFYNYVDDLSYSPVKILGVPELPVLISNSELLELKDYVKDYKYIWNM